jgi:hypothetical protein
VKIPITNLTTVTMAWHPQVAGGDRQTPDKEGNCGYTEYAVLESRQGVVLQFGDLGKG